MSAVDYDPVLIANFGKQAAKDYARFRRSSAKLLEQVEAAERAGHTGAKIEADMLSRCSSREEVVDCAATFSALMQMRDARQS